VIRPAFLIAIMLAAAVSFPAVAQQQPRPPSNTNDSTRRYCRVSDQIGTRLGAVRTCRTKAEWKQFERESVQIVDRMQRVAPPCAPWSRC
jgi:hypothetical protein